MNTRLTSLTDAADIRALDNQIRKYKIEHCQIVRDDTVLYVHERNAHAREKLHKVNSVTKSAMSLLIGIAIDRGELPGVDMPIAALLPQAPADITVAHLLTMTPGWDWPEWGAWGGRPFPMINSKDWVRFILARERVDVPGTKWRYDSGSSQLLSVLLQRAVGMTAAKYAERHLFGPLGIDAYRWYEEAKGYAIGGFSLELRAPDMVKLGQLTLDRGIAPDGRRIVPADWIAYSTARHADTGSEIGDYGAHWWVIRDADVPRDAAAPHFAMGYGGQYIFVVPHERLVVTFASSLYKDTFGPYRLFRQFLLPACIAPSR